MTFTITIGPAVIISEMICKCNVSNWTLNHILLPYLGSVIEKI